MSELVFVDLDRALAASELYRLKAISLEASDVRMTSESDQCLRR